MAPKAIMIGHYTTGLSRIARRPAYLVNPPDSLTTTGLLTTHSSVRL